MEIINLKLVSLHKDFLIGMVLLHFFLVAEMILSKLKSMRKGVQHILVLVF